MARDPLCGGVGRSVLMGEGQEKDVKWEEADSLLSKHLWDPSTSLMCRSLGYWLPPQPTPQHFSMRALTSLLCPPLLLPSLHCPHPSSFPSSASISFLPLALLSLTTAPPERSLSPRSSLSSHTLAPSPVTSLPPSLISTLQRLVINASFNCHAHFYAH